MKNWTRYGIGLVVIFLLATAIFSLQNRTVPKTRKELIIEDIKIAAINIGQTQVNAEVVKTDEERTRGLSGRETLAAGDGMLFVFPSAARYVFWMKGMKFPLDILWIAEGEIVDISENLPPGKGDDPPKYRPERAVDLVLEVNAGFVKKNGIGKGDKITIAQSIGK